MKEPLIVALCQTKGGTGKSTIAESIAVEAAKAGQVLLLDLDPQQSTAKWWRRRGGPDNPDLSPSIKSVAFFMSELRKRGGVDVLIIDTPGSMLGVIRDAVALAHVTVIPISPSVKDWEAMDVVESIAQKAGKREKTIYVVNRYRMGTDTSIEAVRALIERTKRTPLVIALRTDYEKADAIGATAPEINREAAKEIKLVWDTIKRTAKQ